MENQYIHNIALVVVNFNIKRKFSWAVLFFQFLAANSFYQICTVAEIKNLYETLQ